MLPQNTKWNYVHLVIENSAAIEAGKDGGTHQTIGGWPVVGEQLGAAAGKPGTNMFHLILILMLPPIHTYCHVSTNWYRIVSTNYKGL